MKKVYYYFSLTCFILVMFLFKPRQDIVFGAINESQCLRLYENGKEFELRIRDNNLYTGTYTLSKDTVFLLYEEHLAVSRTNLNVEQTENHINLPAKLYISESALQIKSSIDTTFSAEIFLDKRHEFNKPLPVNIRAFNSHRDLITVLGTNGPSVLLQR